MSSSLINHTLHLLSKDTTDSMLDRENTYFDRSAQPVHDRLIVFGAGELGKTVASLLKENGYSPLFFADNNPRLWGLEIDGVKVLSTTEAISQFGETGCFIVAVYNGARVRSQLRELGCKTVLHYAPLFWKYPTACLQAEAVGRPSLIFENTEAIHRAYSVLADDKSRQVFCEQLRWRVLLDSEDMKRPSPTEETYFAPDLILRNVEETFVDCGAFDGDSIRQFLALNTNQFRRIFALEPDGMNRNRLRAWLAQVPDAIADRVTILPYAVGDKRQRVQFSEGNFVASRIAGADPEGTTECVPLDEIMANHEPTFIKMDVEGAEPQAIRGARGILNAHRPVLAACVYHKSQHLWEIPALIRDISPHHQIFLRRYAEDCWELVCYAVPRNRLKASQQ
jgi:FkbM family methyltransferase